MKHFFVALLAIFLSFSVVDAEAKRFGGGRSSGMQRSMDSTPKRQYDNAPTRQQNNATPQKRSWMGPLAGLAAGLGIAALLSHFGLGEAASNFLMVALLVVGGIILFRWIMSRNAPKPAMQYAGMPGGMAPTQPMAYSAHSPQGGAQQLPPGTSRDEVLRDGKVLFIRMQAANDAGDINDLRRFTTPEMFAEAKMLMQEGGSAPQNTDVIAVEADLMDAAFEGGRYLVSLRFFGQIREAVGADAIDFNEVWHLVQGDAETRWKVAGIQQL